MRGPIPWNWLAAAARLPGRALAVAIVLWFEAGVKGAAVVALSQKRLRDWVSRGTQATEASHAWKSPVWLA